MALLTRPFNQKSLGWDGSGDEVGSAAEDLSTKFQIGISSFFVIAFCGSFPLEPLPPTSSRRKKEPDQMVFVGLVKLGHGTATPSGPKELPCCLESVSSICGPFYANLIPRVATNVFHSGRMDGGRD